jgi:hypothetical protein
MHAGNQTLDTTDMHHQTLVSNQIPAQHIITIAVTILCIHRHTLTTITNTNTNTITHKHGRPLEKPPEQEKERRLDSGR